MCSLVTSGRIAKDVSPTRPRVTLDKASSLTGRPNRGATVYVSQEHQTRKQKHIRGIRTRSVNEYMAQMLGAQ